jgi:hypothetical protein
MVVYSLIFCAMPAVKPWPARWPLSASAPHRYLRNRVTFGRDDVARNLAEYGSCWFWRVVAFPGPFALLGG